MFSVLLSQNTVSMLEWTNSPSWTSCISLFPLLELLRVQVHLCSVRCRTSDISFRYEKFSVHTSIGWIFPLCWGLLHQLLLRLLWFSFKETSPPIWSDWCRYCSQNILSSWVTHVAPTGGWWGFISEAEQNEKVFPLSSIHFLWGASCQK